MMCRTLITWKNDFAMESGPAPSFFSEEKRYG